jgi:hypothetical protein
MVTIFTYCCQNQSNSKFKEGEGIGTDINTQYKRNQYFTSAANANPSLTVGI